MSYPNYGVASDDERFADYNDDSRSNNNFEQNNYDSEEGKKIKEIKKIFHYKSLIYILMKSLKILMMPVKPSFAIMDELPAIPAPITKQQMVPTTTTMNLKNST